MATTDPLRRPIPQRSAGWATAIAGALQRAGLRPNHISVASVLVSLVGCGCLAVSVHADDAARTLALVLAALCIPLRLLCNMFDGMLAVEGGLRTPTGSSTTRCRTGSRTWPCSREPAGRRRPWRAVLPWGGWPGASRCLPPMCAPWV